ncbi:MAG: TIGR03905 family TSCPD domain-containing protein [Clostridia bacterium]|nr:TIGR03905 family TSCPD domain-containing protein [Clostridia bacterium]
MTYTFKPSGVCAAKLTFDIEDGIVKNVKFLGGCNGNTQGVARLAEGRPAKEVMQLLKGIKCGFKQTSCPDQFSKALEEALQN